MTMQAHELISNAREFIVIVPVIYISRFALFFPETIKTAFGLSSIFLSSFFYGCDITKAYGDIVVAGRIKISISFG